MVFQPKITLGLIFPDHTNPVKSDSESVTSTIPTKNQTKPSKIDRLGPFVDNAGLHLLTNSGNTQPKIKRSTHAPPHPIRYPQDVIGNDFPGQHQAGTHPTALLVNITGNKPQWYATAPNAEDSGPQGTVSHTNINKAVFNQGDIGQPRTRTTKKSSTTKYTRILLSTIFPSDAFDDETVPITESKSQPEPASVVVAPVVSKNPTLQQPEVKPSTDMVSS